MTATYSYILSSRNSPKANIRDRERNSERAMYTPVQFKVDEAAEAHALMRAHAFAILITRGADGVVATHLPTVLKVDETNPLGRIECHLARPNPQWKTFSPDTDALMI